MEHMEMTAKSPIRSIDTMYTDARSRLIDAVGSIWSASMRESDPQSVKSALEYSLSIGDIALGEIKNRLLELKRSPRNRSLEL